MKLRLTFIVSVVLTIVLTIAVSVAPGNAADTADASMLAPINALVQSLNTGDSGFKTAMASDVTVVDEFAPFVWRGEGAGGKWVSDFGAFLKSAKVTQPHVALNKLLSEEAKGNDAYIIESATFGGNMSGKPFTEQGVWTFILHKTSQGPWVIALQSWARVSTG